MRSLRIDPSLDEPDESDSLAEASRGDASRPGASRSVPARPGRVWRAVAAFLLGLTLGITGIVMVQSAFERHLDLFTTQDSPPPLRR